MKTSNFKSDRMKNAALVILLLAFLGTGFIAYHFAEKSAQLQSMFAEEKVNIEQHLIDTYAEIEQNLSQISAHEGVLKASLKEGEADPEKSPEKRIQREIEIIAALVDRNNHLIDGLNAQVGERDKQLNSYKSRVHQLNKKIENYKEEAATLLANNERLSQDLDAAAQRNMHLITTLDSSSFAIRTQREVIDAQRKTLDSKDAAINEAFFAVGEFQELKESNVLTKEGGVLGVGATKSLKDNFNPAKFTSIDRRTYTTIPVFSKKAEFVTNHDTSSYEIQKDAEGVIQWVKITNPELFWKTGKYCVIVRGSDNYEFALAE